MPHKDPEVRRKFERERHRRRVAERRARGMCPKCGKNPPAQDRSLLRGLPREGQNCRTRPLRQGQIRGCSIRRAGSRESPPHGAGEEQKAQARAQGGGTLHRLRGSSSRRWRRRLRDLPRGTPGGREETLRQAKGRRALRPVRRRGLRGGFEVRFVRRAREEPFHEEERREPGALSRQARKKALRGLRRRCGRRGEMRELRAPVVSLLGRAQGNAHPSAALHRRRARHGRRARPPRLLGGGRDVPRLRKALPGGSRGPLGQASHVDHDGILGALRRGAAPGKLPPTCRAAP